MSELPPPEMSDRAAVVQSDAGSTTEQHRESAQPVTANDTFRFDGGAGTYIGTALLGVLLTVVTFGIGYPFAVVLVERWRAKHTTMDGARMRFTGSATGLLGRWILWLVLSIVTLGIYLFWVVPRLTRWRVEHREFEADSRPDRFRFDGGAATFWGTALVGVLLTVFTLGICYPFAVVLLQRWRTKHTMIDGRRLEFTGSAIGLFGRWILWLILSVVTLGIYLLWVIPRVTRWKVEHQRFA